MGLFKKKKQIKEEFSCSDFSKFCDLVKDQFEYGGKKYALNETRESTDVLFDIYGKNWLFGTMAKYCFRYNNLKRERDLLKIACYAYLLWLKKGFFLQPRGLDNDNIDTNINIKSQYFPSFIAQIGRQIQNKEVQSFTKAIGDCIVDWYSTFIYQTFGTSRYYPLSGNFIEMMKLILEKFADFGWVDISQELLYLIYCLCFKQWVKDEYYKGTTHDTDTNNAK